MLTKLYVDNYKCLVNFELELASASLLLGRNGAGKSTVLEVLAGIRSIVIAGFPVETIFPPESRTRWQSVDVQEFELTGRIHDQSYVYRLQLDTWGRPARRRILSESVSVDGRLLFEFAQGEVQLFNDSFEPKVRYNLDWFRSALGSVLPQRDNTQLMSFIEWLRGLWCFRFNPFAMISQAPAEDAEPARDLSNFASWYRHLSQENQYLLPELFRALEQVIPDFMALELRRFSTESRELAVRLKIDGTSDSLLLGIEQLSEGQRLLIALYTILVFAVTSGSKVIVDEPDNFLALTEIQPWLTEILDKCEATSSQLILISHHPEIVNRLAKYSGILLQRTASGAIRPEIFSPPYELLTPAEIIARGWEHDRV